MEEDFLNKLAALLKEYDADISFVCDDCSDTYGLYGDKVVINIKGKEVFDAQCWGFDYRDIESVLTK